MTREDRLIITSSIIYTTKEVPSVGAAVAKAFEIERRVELELKEQEAGVQSTFRDIQVRDIPE